jgi:hypothetical protein
MKPIADSTLYYIQCKSKKNTASLRVNAIELNRKQAAAFLETFKKHTHILVKMHKPEDYNTSCTYCVTRVTVVLQSGYQMVGHLRDRLVSEKSCLIIIGTFLNTG